MNVDRLIPTSRRTSLASHIRCHHPRRRVIQYAGDSGYRSRGRGLLDARLRGHDGGGSNSRLATTAPKISFSRRVCVRALPGSRPCERKGRREGRVLVAPMVRVQQKSTRQNHRYEPEQRRNGPQTRDYDSRRQNNGQPGRTTPRFPAAPLRLQSRHRACRRASRRRRGAGRTGGPARSPCRISWSARNRPAGRRRRSSAR